MCYPWMNYENGVINQTSQMQVKAALPIHSHSFKALGLFLRRLFVVNNIIHGYIEWRVKNNTSSVLTFSRDAELWWLCGTSKPACLLGPRFCLSFHISLRRKLSFWVSLKQMRYHCCNRSACLNQYYLAVVFFLLFPTEKGVCICRTSALVDTVIIFIEEWAKRG